MKIDPHIRTELKRFFRERIAQNKEKIVIVSAYKLDQNEIQELSLRIPIINKSQNVEYIVDKDIIAGFIVKIGSSVLDLSIKGQLNSLQNFVYERS